MSNTRKGRNVGVAGAAGRYFAKRRPLIVRSRSRRVIVGLEHRSCLLVLFVHGASCRRRTVSAEVDRCYLARARRCLEFVSIFSCLANGITVTESNAE